jgi:hypothetical protein
MTPQPYVPPPRIRIDLAPGGRTSTALAIAALMAMQCEVPVASLDPPAATKPHKSWEPRYGPRRKPFRRK